MEQFTKPVEGQYDGQGAEAIFGDWPQRSESTFSSSSCGLTIGANHGRRTGARTERLALNKICLLY